MLSINSLEANIDLILVKIYLIEGQFYLIKIKMYELKAIIYIIKDKIHLLTRLFSIAHRPPVEFKSPTAPGGIQPALVDGATTSAPWV